MNLSGASSTRSELSLVAACLLVVLFSTLAGCSMKQANQSTPSSQSNQPTPQTSKEPLQAQSSPVTMTPGSLQPGQASGTYTAKGETIEVKYAYAGRGERFGEQSIIVLVTDKPIPAEAVAEELKSQTMLGDEKIRGLEYVFSEGGYWVRFHPSQTQSSKNGQIKEYAVENDVVRGTDEDNGDIWDGKYKRSVKFAATLTK